jgi:hypothetical protein
LEPIGQTRGADDEKSKVNARGHPVLRAILWLGIGNGAALTLAVMITDGGQIALLLAVLLAGWTVFVGMVLWRDPDNTALTPGTLAFVPLLLMMVCMILSDLFWH